MRDKDGVDEAGKQDKQSSKTVRPPTTGRSRLTACELILKSVRSAGKPMTARELNRFDPITLPMAISGAPFFKLAIEAASSGRLVPKAITVKPIISSLTPNAKAMSVAPQTKILELVTSKISPTDTHIIADTNVISSDIVSDSPFSIAVF